jgi:hypothetical protein
MDGEEFITHLPGRGLTPEHDRDCISVLSLILKSAVRAKCVRTVPPPTTTPGPSRTLHEGDVSPWRTSPSTSHARFPNQVVRRLSRLTDRHSGAFVPIARATPGELWHDSAQEVSSSQVGFCSTRRDA